MAFKTTLFKLIDCRRVSAMHIGGYEISEWSRGLDDIQRLAVDDDPEWFFKDQEVELDDGCVEAITCAQDEFDDTPEERVTIEFYVVRQLEPGDL